MFAVFYERLAPQVLLLDLFATVEVMIDTMYCWGILNVRHRTLAAIAHSI